MNTLSLLIGISSSLIATFLFLLLNKIFRTIVIPWYQDINYQGARVDGHWEYERSFENSTFIFTFDLEQKASMISGRHTHIKKDNNQKDSILNYKVNGFVRDGYVAVHILPLAKDAMDYQSGMFRLYHKDDHLIMEGIVVFTDTSHGKLGKLENIIFEKIKS